MENIENIKFLIDGQHTANLPVEGNFTGADLINSSVWYLRESNKEPSDYMATFEPHIDRKEYKYNLVHLPPNTRFHTSSLKNPLLLLIELQL